jgi:hypothetical protein
LEGDTVSKKDFIAREEIRSFQDLQRASQIFGIYFHRHNVERRFPRPVPEGLFEAQLEGIFRSNDKTSKMVWEKLNDTVENHGARADLPVMAI